MKMADVDEPRRAYTDLKFETPTTRMEPYYEAWKPCEQAWPNWEENNEAYVGNPLAEKYPLQFTQTRTRSPITRISRRRSGCSSSPSPRWS